MKALEYAALILIVGALVYVGATKLGNALAESLNATVERIETAGR